MENPENKDANQDAESSTAVVTDAKEATPQSSGEGEADTTSSLLDKLLGPSSEEDEVAEEPDSDAETEDVEAEHDTEEESTDEESGESEDESEGDSKEADEKAEDDKSKDDERFDKHPRFQELRKKAQEYERDATEWRKLDSYLNETQISDQEFRELLEVATLMKHDPQRALELIEQARVNLTKLTGRYIPDDLKQEVEDGMLSEQRAIEINEARASRELAAERERYQRQQAELQQRQQASQQTYAAITNAVTQWDTDTAKRDPEYSNRRQWYVEAITAAHTANPARTPEEAVALCDRVKREVDNRFRDMNPPKRPMGTKTPSSNSSTAGKSTKIDRSKMTSADILDEVLGRK